MFPCQAEYTKTLNSHSSAACCKNGLPVAQQHNVSEKAGNTRCPLVRMGNEHFPLKPSSPVSQRPLFIRCAMKSSQQGLQSLHEPSQVWLQVALRKATSCFLRGAFVSHVLPQYSKHVHESSPPFVVTKLCDVESQQSIVQQDSQCFACSLLNSHAISRV